MMTAMPKRAVVLAGGEGTRLRPYTAVLPKPLMPVGDRPVLDIVLRQLRAPGFERVTIATGYLAELIEAFFGDGERYGLQIDYFREREPLGHGRRAGADRRARRGIPGDERRRADRHGLRALLRRATARPARRRRSRPRRAHDRGLARRACSSSDGARPGARDRLHREADAITTRRRWASTPSRRACCGYIEPGVRLDFPDLVLRLMRRARRCARTGRARYWLDLGRHEDYETAMDEFEAMRAADYLTPTDALDLLERRVRRRAAARGGASAACSALGRSRAEALELREPVQGGVAGGLDALLGERVAHR